MAFVLDASATLPWCFLDEATAQSEILFHRAESREEILVPAHWSTEVLNGLTRAARRGRIDGPDVDSFLAILPNFRISVDTSSFVERWKLTLPLVRRHRLSAYDAAYLALAKEIGVALASADEQLRAAALLEGVRLVP